MFQINNGTLVEPEIGAPKASTLVCDRVVGGGSDVARVYNEIFDAVVDRRLLPGTRLTEAALCRAFSCSRTSVRSALSQLAHDRIVTNEPNRGAFVWQPNAKDTKDIFEMRRGLECMIVDMLIAQAPDAKRFAPLYGMVARERSAFERGDRVSWIRLSNAFHVEMARLLDNQVLTETLHSLCARTTLIIAFYDSPGETACSYLEHVAILDHLCRGDAQAAKDAMHHHLVDCEQRMSSPAKRPADPWTVFHLAR